MRNSNTIHTISFRRKRYILFILKTLVTIHYVYPLAYVLQLLQPKRKQCCFILAQVGYYIFAQMGY